MGQVLYFVTSVLSKAGESYICLVEISVSENVRDNNFLGLQSQETFMRKCIEFD